MIKNICKNKFMLLCLVIIFIKILIMGLFSSDYQNTLFYQFINNYISNGLLSNPYSLSINYSGMFPYPPFMLFVETIGGILSSIFQSRFLINIFFKMPSLFFDILCFRYLLKLFPTKKYKVLILFFMSPIILYSTYMHGQLDIIPISLLIVSLYFLANKKSILFCSLILSLSICSKLNIIAVVPIVLVYIYKNNGFKDMLNSLLIICFSCFIINIPFISIEYIDKVFKISEQSLLTNVILDYSNLQLYLSLLGVCLVYFHVLMIKNMNKELLFSFVGLTFSIFLVLVPPMPGWFVWVIPFLTIYLLESKVNEKYNYFLYYLFCILYLGFFIFCHKTNLVDLYYINSSLQFIKLNSVNITNIVFTLLTSTLIFLTYLMYKQGISINSFYKRNAPFTIGISGDSGSGKSTMLNYLSSIIKNNDILQIEGDGDHKWERGNAMWKHFTHLNPKANYLYKQANDLSLLRFGKSIIRKDYDHNSGKFTEGIKIKPKPYIVLCGLHALYLPQVRQNLDLKIYMDINENLRRYWKIKRDVRKRDYSVKNIINQIDERMDDAKKYVYPQKKYADLIIEYYDDNIRMDKIDFDYEPVLNLKITLSMIVNIEQLIDLVETNNIEVKYDYDEMLEKQTICFSGGGLHSNTIDFNSFVSNTIQQIDEIANINFKYNNSLEGIIQVVLLLLISLKMRGEIS